MYELSDDDLKEMERRIEAASPGPWVSFIEDRDHYSGDDFIRIGEAASGEPDMYVSRARTSGLVPASAGDLDFIAHSRQDIPTLLAEVARLKRLDQG